MPGKPITAFFPGTAPLVVFLMLAASVMPLVPDHVSASGGGEGYPYQGSGDWIIDSPTYVYNETVVVNGKLIIQDGGRLTLKGTVIKMNVSSDGEYYIEVQAGGELHVLDWDNDPTTTDDRSVLTDGDHDNDSAAYNSAENHRYSIRVRAAAAFIMTNSELRESGFGGGDNAGVSLDGRADFVYEGNYVAKCFRGLQLYYSYGPGKQVRNNTFDACESAGIIMYYSHNTTLEDNEFYNGPHEGIYLYSHPSNPAYYTSDNIIRNNYFQDNIYGTYLYGANCYRNEFYNNEHVHDRYGITTTTDPNNNTFRDIQLRESWSYAIYTTTRSVNNTYRDLEITDSNYAILTTGRSYNNLYENIQLKDTTNYAIYPTGKSHDNYYVNCVLDNQKYGILATDDVWNTWLVNSTFRNTVNTEVYVDEGANLTLLNTPFSSLVTSGGSYLTEMNYLDIHVEDMRGNPIPGADVSVLSREMGIEEDLPENLASPRLGTQATATSEYNWRWLAERAVDGRTEDGTTQEHYWLSKNNPPADTYFMLDFSAVKEFDLIRLINVRNAGYQDRSTKDFRLMVSSNGTWFEEIHRGTMTEHDITNWYEVQLPEPARARYLRFYVDSHYGNSAGLGEIEVYNTSRTTKSFSFQGYATELFGGSDLRTDAQGNVNQLPVITRRWYNHYGPQVVFENDVTVAYRGWEEERAGLRLSSSTQLDIIKDTLTVGPSDRDFTTIQAAVNYASAGPEKKVKVFPGNYSENVVVSDKELRLFTAADDHNDTFILAGGGTGLAVSGNEHFAAEGLVIKGANVGVDNGGMNKTYSGISFEGTTTPFLVRDHARLETIDSSYDSSDIVFENGTGVVYEKNRLVVEVRGRYGGPVADADVEVWDKDRLFLTETTSSANGLASPQTLLHRVLRQGSETPHSPYEVTVRKGDGNFSETVVMDIPQRLIMTWYDPMGFGEALAAGDLDGDGFDDYAVGAPGYDGTGRNSGAVFFYRGGDHLVIEDLTPENYDVLILGERENDRFGSSLALDGDLNGDGRSDLVIGAPYTNHTFPYGITTSYYHSQGEDKFAELVLEQRESTINYNWGNDKPHDDVNADNFGIKWNGFIKIEKEGEYSFHIYADDGVHFYFDEELLIDQWTYSANEYSTDVLYLEEGLYPFLVEHHEGGGGARMELRWSSEHFAKEVVPAETFWYTDDWGVGRGGIYIINGGERFPGAPDGPHPLKATVEVSSLPGSFLEEGFGVWEFGKQTAYLGDLNRDGYHELGVSTSLDGNEDLDRLHILHGSPLTTQYDFRELIPALPEEDGGSKDFSTLFDPVEWEGPVTGNGGLLDASPEGDLLLDCSQGNPAYAYLLSPKGVPSGLDLSLKFGKREEAEEHPVLRIMNHSLTLPELGEGALQDDSSLLVLYDNGSVKLRSSPGAEPLQLEATGLNGFPEARVVVSPDHRRISVYFNEQLLSAMDIQGWEEELYLVVGDSSSDRYGKVGTLVWLKPGLYAETLNFNASGVKEDAVPFAGGRFTKDGNHQLVVGARETYLFRSEGVGLLQGFHDDTTLYEGGSFNDSFYRNGSLTVSGELPHIILNGDFANGWDNWTFDKNSQNQKLAKERLVTEAVGDWTLSPLSGSPTAGYGIEDDTLDAANGQSTGMLKSDPFTITAEVDRLRLWRRWKVMSFDNSEGMNIKLYRSSDDTELLTIDEWMAPGDSQNHEVEDVFTVDVREFRGETVYLAMETIGGDGPADDGLFQLDDVAALGTKGSGSFVSKEMTLPNGTKAVLPQWAQERNEGTISFRFRTSNETDWEDAPLVENGQFLTLEEGTSSFQFRFDLNIQGNHSSPEIRNLEFLFFNASSMPLRINTTGAYYPDTGDIDGDGLHELLLGSGSREELLVLDGSDIEQALDADQEYLVKENHLMSFAPDGGEDSREFGAQTSVVRDIDGDGLRDILVSDPSVDGGEKNAGVVYCFYSSDTKRDYNIADAAREIPGDVEGGRLGSRLGKNLASQPGGVAPRVEHLPFHLHDVSIATFSLENNSFVYPNTTLRLRMKVANIGFLNAQDIEYFMNISSDQGDYETSVRGSFSEIEVDGSEDVTLDWDVPKEEDVPYTIQLTLTMKGDLSLGNNELTIRTRSRYFRTELATGNPYDYKRVHEYLVYTVTITNTGTMGDDTVNLSAEVPEHWEYRFDHEGKQVSTLTVVQEEEVKFRVRSPANATASNDSYHFTVTATSQNNITNSTLPLQGHLVDVDIVAVAINLYREDMVEIGSTRHLIEDETSTLEVVLFNAGNLSTCPFSVKILQDESLMEEVDVEPLASQSYLNITRQLVLGLGDTSFRVVVDEGNQCLEYNELNNGLLRQTTVKDDDPDNEYHVYCTIRNMDRQPVAGARLLVNVEGNSHEFTAETNETGQAHLFLETTDYYEGLQMKVGGVKGSKYDYVVTNIYSDDGEFRTELMLEKYSLDVWVDSLSKVMSLNPEGTAYEPVEYRIIVENSGILDEDYELYAIRPFGWRYEFRGNIIDRGAGLYDLTVAANSSEEVVFSVFNTDRMDSPVSKNIHANQKANITFFVESTSTPFVIERTTITHVRPEDNLTIDGLNIDGKLYEEDGRFYKELVPGSSSLYTMNLINFGNTNKEFLLLDHGENASFAEVDRTRVTINCLHNSLYRAEFVVNLTVPEHLREGERFQLDLLLIDENNTFSEYVKLGVLALKRRDVSFALQEARSPGGNETRLFLELSNPTGDELFVEFVSASFMDSLHTGSVIFTPEHLTLEPGGVETISISVSQDNMEMTTKGDPIGLRFSMLLDNDTTMEKPFFYPAQCYHRLTLTTEVSQRMFYPGESHIYTLTLKNKGNGPTDIASFAVDDHGGWAITIHPRFLDKGEEQHLNFRVTAPPDAANGIYNNITITPYSENGLVHEPLKLVNRVQERARALSMSYYESEIEVGFVNHTLRVRNDGNFNENVRAEVVIPRGYVHSIIPRHFMVAKDRSKYISLRVEAPGDSLVFSNYTVRLFPLEGSEPIAELELHGFPVSRIEHDVHGKEYTFSAASGYAERAEFFWEINGGSFPLTREKETSPAFTVNFQKAGNYTVTLTTSIMDETVGPISDRATVVITIENQEPDLSGLPETLSLEANESFTIDAAGAMDLDGTIVDVMFVHNGSTIHATKLTSSFVEPGTYRITIVVMDNLGAVAEKEVSVTVTAPSVLPVEEENEHIFSKTEAGSLFGVGIMLLVLAAILASGRRGSAESEAALVSRLEAMRSLRKVREEGRGASGTGPGPAGIPGKQEAETTLSECGNCGEYVPETMGFCTSCGTKLGPVENEGRGEFTSCHACQRPVGANIRFCIFCGEKQETGPVPVNEDEMEDADVDDAVEVVEE